MSVCLDNGRSAGIVGKCVYAARCYIGVWAGMYNNQCQN